MVVSPKLKEIFDGTTQRFFLDRLTGPLGTGWKIEVCRIHRDFEIL